ncbi:hypothetical protein POTOM_060169 [Populus tomentosa]|uniref:Uncharacterized protein n=1 Tax=Populus tomentosa TaxID=118781 RepID=A0A8X8C260_POPTO|nr:hypothetical protein POTOM_060169 [Populus tomentosa]
MEVCNHFAQSGRISSPDVMSQTGYFWECNINCNFYKDWDSSVGAIDELHPHPIGGGKLKFLESYNISDVEEGPLNSADQFADNTDSLIRLVEPEITSTIDMTPENPSLESDSLEMFCDNLASFQEAEAILEDIRPSPVPTLGYGVDFAAASYALLDPLMCFLSPVRLGVQAFSWAAGKLENNRIGLPTSPLSSDVQNWVQAAAKYESLPSETEVPNPSPESVTPLNEKVDLSEA